MTINCIALHLHQKDDVVGQEPIVGKSGDVTHPIESSRSGGFSVLRFLVVEDHIVSDISDDD